MGESLEAGIVGINEGAVVAEMVPLGGTKESGFGQEGSKYGVDDYINLKYICLGNV